jgi:hypothetical protein
LLALIQLRTRAQDLRSSASQHSIAGKAQCSRIKHLRLRLFYAEKLNRTAAQSSDSKWRMSGQVPTLE